MPNRRAGFPDMHSFPPLRVLFFSHETTWSGAPIQLLHLALWLKRAGGEVAVAVPKPTTAESGPISLALAEAGVPTFPVVDLTQPPDFTELAALCRRFEVVIANTLVMWAAVRAANEQGVPVIWYIHESFVAQHLIALNPEIVPALAMADVLVMPTRRTAQLYKLFTDRPIEVVPYGIPAAQIPPDLPPREPGLIRFLLLGTYEPRKGQDLFLQAIKHLRSSTTARASFEMAGRVLDQSFHETLTHQSAPLPHVRLRGALSHNEALAASAAADVLVCSSRDETMPIAILEAMSLGKTVVTTNVGGVAEWLRDGVNALLVPPEDHRALAEALRRCVEEQGLIESLGANARRTFFKHFSIDRLGERFSVLLEQAQKKRGI